MAELKTRETAASVDGFLDAVEHPVRRADARAIRAMMERVSGAPARMWGPSIIGFGSYSYRYESGHGGEMCRMGFSPRKGHLVLYVGGYPGFDGDLARFGKHKRSKGCLYVNKLADIDAGVLEAIVARSWAASEGIDRCQVC